MMSNNMKVQLRSPTNIQSDVMKPVPETNTAQYPKMLSCKVGSLGASPDVRLKECTVQLTKVKWPPKPKAEIFDEESLEAESSELSPDENVEDDEVKEEEVEQWIIPNKDTYRFQKDSANNNLLDTRNCLSTSKSHNVEQYEIRRSPANIRSDVMEPVRETKTLQNPKMLPWEVASFWVSPDVQLKECSVRLTKAKWPPKPNVEIFDKESLETESNELSPDEHVENDGEEKEEVDKWIISNTNTDRLKIMVKRKMKLKNGLYQMKIPIDLERFSRQQTI